MLVLLATWLLCILGLTAVMWRPTPFSGTLDSCAAVLVQLLVDRADLVSEECDGSLEDNKRLLERFAPRYTLY